MTTVVVDIECDDLMPFLTRIWCVSVLDVSSGDCTTYTDREPFLAVSRDWDVIIGHNLLGYDLWVLYREWGIPFTVGKDTFNGKSVEFVDTLVNSRYQNPDRGYHSLAEWGEKLGFPKGEHSDWTQYSEAMAEYNRQDCRVTAEVWKALMKELES